MASFSRSDLDFVLKQILIAEQHTAGADLASLVPDAFAPFGLRTVDGSFNNLIAGQSNFGAADQFFTQRLPHYPRSPIPISRPLFRAARYPPAIVFNYQWQDRSTRA